MPARRSIAAVLIVLWSAPLAIAQICQQGWANEFAGPQVGVYARAQVIFDADGPGPMPAALYVAGNNFYQGQLYRWDGSQLAPFGPAFRPTSYNPAAQSLVVHDDDGPGPMPPAMYAGGAFDRVGTLPCSGLARWNGVAWAAITPPDGSIGPWHVWTLDADGTQSMYASAGDGYTIPSNLWRRDGAAWTRIGKNHALPFSINSIAAFDADGSGPGAATLYATGSSPSATALARLEGATWTTIATGSPVPYSTPRFGPLAVFDADGPGPNPPVLVMGGRMHNIGSVQVHGLAQFNGQEWSDFYGGVSTSPSFYANVLSLAAIPEDPGGGQALYVGGYFARAGQVAAEGIARFAAGQWWSPEQGVSGGVTTIGPAPSAPFAGPNMGVFIGGDFTYVDGFPVYGLTGFSRLGWAPLGQVLNNDVQAAIAWTDPAAGPGLYVGGGMTIAGGRVAVGIARYDGHAWTDLDVGVNNRVTALCTFRGNLVAGGLFTTAGGIPAQHIASWNGSAWSPLGAGLNGPVRALAEFDSGQGPILFAGGEFTQAGNVQAFNIASWDGAAWSPVDSGTNGPVNAMTVWNRPEASDLIVGGLFTSAGYSGARNVARWDGARWSALTEHESSLTGKVLSLAIHDEGSGPELFAGGQFTIPGDPGGRGNIAQLDTDHWLPLRQGVYGTVHALASWRGNPASESILFVGGDFYEPGGTGSRNAARWVYHTWRPIGGEVSDPVAAAAVFDSSVFLGGSFRQVGYQYSARLARWTQCAPCYVNCDGSNGVPALSTADFICFLNLFAEGSPYANCDGSTTPPTLNINDFICFLSRFGAGCP